MAVGVPAAFPLQRAPLSVGPPMGPKAWAAGARPVATRRLR